MINNTSCPRFVVGSIFRFIPCYSQGIGIWTKIFSTIFAACLLTGCAQLGTMLLPETDPHLVNAAATAKSSEVVVKSFREYEAANRNSVDNDTKYTARGLENFDKELNDLKILADMYRKYRSGENLSRLATQTRKVQGARDQAATAMVGGPVERGQGAPYAPPQPGAMPPSLPPPWVDAIIYRMDRQDERMTAMTSNIARNAHAVWSITNTVKTIILAPATNAPAIPK